MVSHPETGSDSPIGSDRDRGRDNPKSYSDIGTKIISELNSFCLQNNVMLKNGEDACDRAYSVNFLNDSKLLDLGSAFNQCLSLGACALIKQYAKNFHA